MLMLSGVCLTVAFFTFILKFKSRKTKWSIFAMEIFSFFMLIADRNSYLYNGNASKLGYFLVYSCNLLTYLLVPTQMIAFNTYILSILSKDKKITYFRLKLTYILSFISIVLIFISIFTKWYFFVDDKNLYQRGNLFILSYIFPFLSVIVQLSFIVQKFNILKKQIRLITLFFPFFIFLASFTQIFTYGISLNTFAFSIMTVALFVTEIINLNNEIRKQSDNIQDLFTQTVEALAEAIDTKDNYTHGHSTRVAEYSVKIAKKAGKDDLVCKEIYYAGLLHDIGKIGIADNIITKPGKLTEEEFLYIKRHPSMGYEILSKITKFPSIMLGAHYHHEHYDGTGYPEHLKGEEIPEYARIIAVADAYDAMTSKRSYRDPIPQQKVREEILKGLGSQFDPEFGNYMLRLIDIDTTYQMKEKEQIENLSIPSKLICEDYRKNISPGILITKKTTTIRFTQTQEAENSEDSFPALILFDSLEGRTFRTDFDKQVIEYLEYGTIHLNGEIENLEMRNYKINILKDEIQNSNSEIERFENLQINSKQKRKFIIEAVRFDDHLLIKINNSKQLFEIIIALPNSTNFSYLAITGKNCEIDNIAIEKKFKAKEIDENYIPRIAEKISYIDNQEGDLPNVQIDSWRTAFSEGILIEKSTKITFHYKTLPFSTRLWHCPSFVFFTSDDRKVFGQNFKSLAAIKLTGECWSESEYTTISSKINKTITFSNWEEWKKSNKIGTDCTISLERKSNKIIFKTINNGLEVTSEIIVNQNIKNIYISLTGDQCVITNIKINN